MSAEPQTTRAWAEGARGEEVVGHALDKLLPHGVYLLHDRRMPGGGGNIDHIVVAPTGVYVIDAKRYKGRPRLDVKGGLFRPPVRTLLVGRRNCGHLVAGLQRQLVAVRAALGRDSAYATVPVRGMLCFVDADWPLIGGSFTIDDVQVLWPGQATRTLTRPGQLADGEKRAMQQTLSTHFPAA